MFICYSVSEFASTEFRKVLYEVVKWLICFCIFDLKELFRIAKEKFLFIDLAVKCIFKLSTGALWLVGTGYLMHRHKDDPETLKRMLDMVIIPSGGLVAAIIFQSVEVVVRITELKALEDIWTR